MKAYLLKKSGKPEVLKVSEVPTPSPASSHVLVKVSHIGLNYAEILSRRGQYSWAPKRPYIPGMEAVGEIVAVGEGVSKDRIGQKVIAGHQFGSYAEYMEVKDYLALPAPDFLTEEESASLLVNFMTAWIALMQLGRMRKGDTVLIQAAAGGVGTAAVKLALAQGCHVIGTAGSDEKVQLLKDIGVHHAINYRKQDFYKEIKQAEGGVDLVLEVVGGEVFRKSVALLRPFGRVTVAGYASIPLKKWNPLTWWPAWRDAPKMGISQMAEHSLGIAYTHIGYQIENPEVVRENFSSMLSFIKEHKIKPVVGKVFPFGEMPEAHAYMESRQSHGKIVIRL